MIRLSALAKYNLIAFAVYYFKSVHEALFTGNKVHSVSNNAMRPGMPQTYAGF